MKVNVKMMSKFAVQPRKGKPGSAGFDLYLPEESGPLMLPYNSRRRIDTGVVFEVPQKSWVLIAPRSSWSTLNIRLSNTIGVVDPTYSGPDDHLLVDITRGPRLKSFVGIVPDERLLEPPHFKAWFTQQPKNKEETYSVEDLNNRKLVLQKDSFGGVHVFIEDEEVYELYKPGQRFVQVVFLPFEDVELLDTIAEEWGILENRGGYGSSGNS